MSTFFEVAFIVDQNRSPVKSGGQIFEKRETVTAFYRAKTRSNGFYRPPPRSLNRSARSSKVKIMICSCWFYFSKLCGENQYLFGHFPPQFLSKSGHLMKPLQKADGQKRQSVRKTKASRRKMRAENESKQGTTRKKRKAKRKRTWTAAAMSRQARRARAEGRGAFSSAFSVAAFTGGSARK